MRSLRPVLVLLGVLVGLILAGEAYFRLVLSRAPLADDATAQPTDLASITEFDPVLGIRYRPNSDLMLASGHDEFAVLYKINELGLRDRPMGSHLRKEIKILALGDEQLEGWGTNIEDTFIKVAEKQLNARTKLEPPIRLVNAGRAGFGAAQSYLYGAALIETLRPAAAVLFYTSAMPHADRRYLALAERDPQGIARGLTPQASQAPLIWRSADQTGGAPAWLTGFARISALANHLRNALIRRNARAAVIAGDPATDPLAGIRGGKDRLLDIHADSLAHVGALAAAAAASGTPLLVLQLPLPPQVGAEEWLDGRRLLGLGSALEPTHDVAVVAAYCAQRQLTCRSADQTMREAAGQRTSTHLYYRHDPTPNVEGDKVLASWTATALYDWLEAQGLL